MTATTQVSNGYFNSIAYYSADWGKINYKFEGTAYEKVCKAANILWQAASNTLQTIANAGIFLTNKVVILPTNSLISAGSSALQYVGLAKKVNKKAQEVLKPSPSTITTPQGSDKTNGLEPDSLAETLKPTCSELKQILNQCETTLQALNKHLANDVYVDAVSSECYSLENIIDEGNHFSCSLELFLIDSKKYSKEIVLENLHKIYTCLDAFKNKSSSKLETIDTLLKEIEENNSTNTNTSTANSKDTGNVSNNNVPPAPRSPAGSQTSSPVPKDPQGTGNVSSNDNVPPATKNGPLDTSNEGNNDNVPPAPPSPLDYSSGDEEKGAAADTSSASRRSKSVAKSPEQQESH